MAKQPPPGLSLADRARWHGAHPSVGCGTWLILLTLVWVVVLVIQPMLSIEIRWWQYLLLLPGAMALFSGALE